MRDQGRFLGPARTGLAALVLLFTTGAFSLTAKAGLWDKPNEACMTKCSVFIKKGCFQKLAEKNPTADPGSIQDECDNQYSVCLYDCMCDTCDENQIIIKEQ